MRALVAFLACTATAIVIAASARAASPARSAGPSSAAPAPAVRKVDFATLSNTTRLRFLLQLIKRGRYKLAARLLKIAPFTGKHGPNRILFVEGMIAKAGRDLKTARDKFRTALASDPGLGMVRAELAHTLYVLGEDTAAKHHLNLLTGAAPTPALAKTFEGFINAIDKRRPWRFNAYAAMAPSTNFTNGTTQETVLVGGIPFQIAGNARKKSGIGVRAGANGGYTFRPGKDLSVTIGAGVNLVQYAGRRYDDISVSQSFIVERRTRKGSIGIGASASQRWAGLSERITTVGPQVIFKKSLSPRTGLFTKARYVWNTYKDASYRNGYTAAFDAQLSYALAAHTVLYALSGFERTKTKQRHLDYRAAYFGLAAYHEFPLGITVYAQAKARRKIYDGDFPLTTSEQRDTLFTFRSTFTKRDFEIFGLAPQLEYTFTHNRSSSPFSRYTTHGTSLTMTKAF